MATLPTFFLRQYRPGKCLLRYSRTKKRLDDILEQKNTFLGYNNKKFNKSKNWHFSKGVNPWFWSKIGHFSSFFFLGNIGQENVFYDVLEQKKAFLRKKNKKFKKSKNWHFSKGLNPWFWFKNGHFSNFYSLGNIGQENVFYDIRKRKNAFLGYKKKKFKKSKNWHFSKGSTHGLGPKMALFQTFFFKQYRPGKCLFGYSRTKKHFLKL